MLNPLLESILQTVHQSTLKRHKLFFFCFHSNCAIFSQWERVMLFIAKKKLPNPMLLVAKNRPPTHCVTVQHMKLLCHAAKWAQKPACMCMCTCTPATQSSTLAGRLRHSIYGAVIWGLAFSLRPKFWCPCAAKISLCACVNHLSYAHATLRKGQGCHLSPAALLSYLCVSYSRPLAASRRCYPSTLFYSHCTNNTDIKCLFFPPASAQMLPQIKTRVKRLFICVSDIKADKRHNLHWSCATGVVLNGI